VQKIQGIRTGNFRGLAGDCLGSRNWRKKLGIRTRKFGNWAQNFIAGRKEKMGIRTGKLGSLA
jgi:hypothetical protein